MSDQLRPCGNNECKHLLAGGAAYCCGPCAHADENRYEIHAHSDRCSKRQPEPEALDTWMIAGFDR